MSKIALSSRAIALLDSARAAAAIYVVVHHLAVTRGWGDGLSATIFRFGQEAVILFFLLSGFVIFANERDRTADIYGYFFRRIRRIYPPLLFALVVSTLVFWDNGTLQSHFSLWELFGSLIQLQDISELKPGVIVSPYLKNDPLWSLSYEMAFYVAFPAVLAAWKRYTWRCNVAIGIACTVAYVTYAAMPNHLSLITSYFLVWWCGAMAAHAYGCGFRLPTKLPFEFAGLAALCLVSAAVVIMQGYRGLGVHPFLEFRHFIVALAVLAIGFSPIGKFLAVVACRVAAPAKAISSISYGVYVLHFPLLVQSRHAEGWSGLVLMTAILIPLAYVADNYSNNKLPRWENVKSRLKLRSLSV